MLIKSVFLKFGVFGIAADGVALYGKVGYRVILFIRGKDEVVTCGQGAYMASIASAATLEQLWKRRNIMASTALLLAGRQPRTATMVRRFILDLVVIHPAKKRLREMAK